MQETSALYKEILANPNCTMETNVVIGETGSLIDEEGTFITFGGMRILVNRGEPGTGYGHDILKSVDTDSCIFHSDEPSVGDCVSAEIDIELLKPKSEIPRMAKIIPFIRLSDGVRTSEWVQKGVYWIDTREIVPGTGIVSTVKLHGYDSLIKADVDCPVDMEWPATDIAVVRRIAQEINVSVDKRTVDIMAMGYPVQLPTGYSCREVLGYIAASYGGCFVMSDKGELRLIQLI